MAVTLPILGFVGLWIYSGNTRREPNWRAAFIQSLILWFAWLVITTELLSLFGSIHRTGLSVSWGSLVLLSILWVIWWLRKGSVLRLPVNYRGKGRKVAILDVLLTLIILIPLIIGFIAPPNSAEAMNFGMARVAHWAQNQSMAHFVAGNESLNSAPPGAGYAILNFYVLSGSDRWSNFPSWIAFVGCLEAVMAIAGLFGATQVGKRFAAVFALTIPAGLALASGALDDLQSCLWVCSFVLIVFFAAEDKKLEFNLSLAALASGLAFITKPVTLLFIIPFAIYFIINQLQKKTFWRVFTGGLIGLLLIILLVSGFVGRNFATYGTAYDMDAYFADLNEFPGWKSTISNATRDFAVHTTMPFSPVNEWVNQQILIVHQRLGLAADDPRTTIGGVFEIPATNTSELTSGNPFHWLIAAGVTVAVIILYWRKKFSRQQLMYLLMLIASQLIYLILLKWRPIGPRWHLIFLVMFAPMVGLVWDLIESKFHRWGTICALFFLVASIPWIISVQERPLLPLPGHTYPTSILTTPRDRLYFSTEMEEEPFYLELSRLVLERPAVQAIGLVFDKPFLEYPVWAMTQNTEGHTHISYRWATGASKKYELTDVEADFILTDRCQNPDNFPGFSLVLHSELGKCLFAEKTSP